MSKSIELVKAPSGELIHFTDEQVALIKSVVANQDLSNDEFKVFLSVAKRRGLDPLLRQIHAVKRAGKMTIQTGIDGYRLIAARTGEYAGNDEPKFVMNGRLPDSASVTVYRLVQGQRVPFTATAYWEEYFPGDNNQGFMWKKMPRGQLAKCAEALALRKAFPGELSGIYADDEMHQADNKVSQNAFVVDERTLPETKPQVVEAETQTPVCDCGTEMMISKFNPDELYCNPRSGGCGAKRPRVG